MEPLEAFFRSCDHPFLLRLLSNTKEVFPVRNENRNRSNLPHGRTSRNQTEPCPPWKTLLGKKQNLIIFSFRWWFARTPQPDRADTDKLQRPSDPAFQVPPKDTQYFLGITKQALSSRVIGVIWQGRGWKQIMRSLSGEFRSGEFRSGVSDRPHQR